MAPTWPVPLTLFQALGTELNRDLVQMVRRRPLSDPDCGEQR